MVGSLFRQPEPLTICRITREWSWNPFRWRWYTANVPCITLYKGEPVDGSLVSIARGPYFTTKVTVP